MAHGLDDVSPYILMKCAETFEKPLELVSKKSMDEGLLPREWKRVNIVPIFKKGDRKKAFIYRPKSLNKHDL